MFNTNLRNVNAYDVIPGFRRLAELTGINLAAEPTEEEFQHLFKAWGDQIVYENNVSGLKGRLPMQNEHVPTEEVLDLLEGTGTLQREPILSIAGPRRPLPSQKVVPVLPTGTANWTQRRFTRWLEAVADGELPYDGSDPVFTLAGDRVCDTVTELDNTYVRLWLETIPGAYYPNEGELARFMQGQTQQRVGKAYFGPSLEANAQRFARDRVNKELFEPDSDKVLFVPVNASAASQALYLRRAIRQVHPGFDAAGNRFFWSQDGFQLARTPAQMDNSQEYQNPIRMFSGLVRHAHAIFQVVQEG